jgi:hypothetical protein
VGRNVQALAGFILAVLAGLSIYFAACENRSSVGPTSPRDYPLYYYDLGDRYYRIHAVTGQVDTLQIPIESTCFPWSSIPRCTNMRASADGKLLFVTELDTTFVVNVADCIIIERLPYDGVNGVSVSPDGKKIAILGQGLYLLSSSDYSVVFHSGATLGNGNFSADSRSFYASGEGGVYKVALDSTRTMTRKTFPQRWVMEAIPSIDESKWYLCTYAGWDCSIQTMAVEVYDVASDSITSRVSGRCHKYDWPDIELTSNGKYLVYAVRPSKLPQIIIEPPFLRPLFGIYAVGGDRLTPLAIDFDGNNNTEFKPAEIEITPDGRWVVGTVSRNLILIDLRTLHGRGLNLAGGSGEFYGLTCHNLI